MRVSTWALQKATKLCPKILISKHLPCETEHLLLWTKYYFETQYIFFNFSLFWMIFMVMGASSAVPYTSLNSNAPNRDPHEVHFLWTPKTAELCWRKWSSLKTSVWTLVCILSSNLAYALCSRMFSSLRTICLDI
jgi:hypothetical protein